MKRNTPRNYYSAVRVRRWTSYTLLLLYLSTFVSFVLTLKGLLMAGIAAVPAFLLTVLIALASAMAWTLAVNFLPGASRKRRGLFFGLLAIVFLAVFPVSTYYSALYTAAPRAQRQSIQAQVDDFGVQRDRLITARRSEASLRRYVRARGVYFQHLAENEKAYGAVTGVRGKSQFYGALLQLAAAYEQGAELLDENAARVETEYLQAIATSKRLAMVQLGEEGDIAQRRLEMTRLLIRANEHLRVLNYSEVDTALLMIQEAEDGIRQLPVAARKKKLLPKLEAGKQAIIEQMDSGQARLSQLVDDMDNGKRPSPQYRVYDDIEAIFAQWEHVWSFGVAALVPDFFVQALGCLCIFFVRTMRPRPKRRSKGKGAGASAPVTQGKELGHATRGSHQEPSAPVDPFRQHFAG